MKQLLSELRCLVLFVSGLKQIAESLKLVEDDEVGLEHREATAGQRAPEARDKLIASMALLVGDKTLAGAPEKLGLLLEIGGKRWIGDQRFLETLDHRRFKTALLVDFGLHLIEQISPAFHAGIGLKKIFGGRSARCPRCRRGASRARPVPAARRCWCRNPATYQA